MARFVAGRLLLAAMLIVASSSAALFLTRLAPGNVSSELGPNATDAQADLKVRLYVLPEIAAAVAAATPGSFIEARSQTARRYPTLTDRAWSAMFRFATALLPGP